MKDFDFEAVLNAEQYAAVTAPCGPMLVLAAAGTGKTRTLIYRMAWLVHGGVSAERILLLTFTNRAAGEMLRRAEEVVGTGVAGLWGGTFHHMANRVLRRYGRKLGYSPDFTILDRDDSRTLVGECVKELGFKSREFPRKEVLLSLFSMAANTESPLEDILQQRFEGHEAAPDDILKVHRMYAERKKKLGAMDFDDLLVKCLLLLSEAPDVLSYYQDKFKHVLVDEYQDTNTIQAKLVDRIGGKHRNVFVVGDDFQSIYSWRGANFKNIMTFPERYPDAGIFKLETNYRSVPEVLEVANACIAGNPEQYQKRLRATRDTYQRPMAVRLRDGAEQAAYAVHFVRQLCRDGYRLSDIAVLYRAHFHSLELQLALAREGIRHVITSGIRFFEQMHVKDACSVVRIAASPGDEMAFTRLLGLLHGAGPRTAARTWQKLGGRFNVLDPAQRKLVSDCLRAQARAQWARLEPVLTEYLGERTGRDAGEIIARFVDRFYDEYAVNNFENYDSRMDDIRELILHAGKCATLEHFLGDVALLTNVDTEEELSPEEAENCMHLSTVHQAKGLEWPVVIVLWASEGMFPSPRSLRESGSGEAEERRLFYVAVTRAKDELCLCTPEIRRMREGGIVYHAPSRFVTEIPANLFRQVRGGLF